MYRVAAPMLLSVRVLCLVLCPASLILSAAAPLRAQSHADRSPTAAAEPCTLQTGGVRAVASVVGADTVVLDDGTQVRLAGILAPTPPAFVAPFADWPPLTAARSALSDLLVGRTVELAFADPRSDRWGRLLAHVFVSRGAEREWVQGYLLRHGHARVDAVPDALACLSELLAHERAGMRADLGLWRNPAYRIRWADTPQRLMRLRNTFQLVEGRVRKVALTRGRIYLNFGDDWRADFTASASRRARPFSTEAVSALQRLEGRRVRIRGWIERRNGPYVELFHPLQVEDVEAEALPPTSGVARGTPAPADRVPGTAAAPPGSPPPNAKRPEREVPGAIDL